MKKLNINKIVISISVLAVFCILAAIVNTSHNTENPSKDISIEQGKKDDILGKYLAIKEGMSFSEVTEIMGDNYIQGHGSNGTQVIKYCGYAKGNGHKMNIYFEIENDIVKQSYPYFSSKDDYKFFSDGAKTNASTSF
jgi:hypothetical protein